jgi:hypothetical protein
VLSESANSYEAPPQGISIEGTTLANLGVAGSLDGNNAMRLIPFTRFR